MNRVTHFEIPAADPRQVMDFFSQTFGWRFTEFDPGNYWMAETGATGGTGEPGSPGINGAIMKRRDPAQPVVTTILVANIDDTIDKIKTNGGTIVVEKMEVPSTGWLAYFKGPDGNIHGVWQTK